jgi:hypothetical protein
MNAEAKSTFYAACGGGGGTASLESVKTALSKYPSLINEIIEESVRIIRATVLLWLSYCFVSFLV